MATIYEVSKLAGVSLATVSRVVNNSAKVRESTRVKVEAAMKELGFRPNAIARSLATNRTDTVGIVISELDGPFYGPMMTNIEAKFRAANKHAIFTAGHSKEDSEKNAIQFLLARRVDALILHVESVTDSYLEEVAKEGVPIVVIGRQVESTVVASVDLDNEMGGYLAAKAVIAAGHREIAYISGPSWKVDASQRLAGHRRALVEAGLFWQEQDLFEGDYLAPSGYECAAKALSQNPDYSAIVCANDEMASGVLLKLREQGVSVPQDVSVVGFDNVTHAKYLYPALTTIDHPIGEMASYAANWVLSACYDQKVVDHASLVKPALIERESLAKI